MDKTKRMRYPVMITRIGAILMLLMLFLPFAASDEDFEEWLMENEDGLHAEELDMTNAEAVDISLFEFGRIYLETARQDIEIEISIICLVIISLFAGFAVLTLLVTLAKKPVATILSDMLMVGIFKLICFDFEDRGVIPSHFYEWGIVYYLVYVIGVIIFAGAIWLLVEKRRAKKMAKAEPDTTALR